MRDRRHHLSKRDIVRRANPAGQQILHLLQAFQQIGSLLHEVRQHQRLADAVVAVEAPCGAAQPDEGAEPGLQLDVAGVMPVGTVAGQILGRVQQRQCPDTLCFLDGGHRRGDLFTLGRRQVDGRVRSQEFSSHADARSRVPGQTPEPGIVQRGGILGGRLVEIATEPAHLRMDPEEFHLLPGGAQEQHVGAPHDIAGDERIHGREQRVEFLARLRQHGESLLQKLFDVHVRHIERHHDAALEESDIAGRAVGQTAKLDGAVGIFRRVFSRHHGVEQGKARRVTQFGQPAHGQVAMIPVAAPGHLLQKRPDGRFA